MKDTTLEGRAKTKNGVARLAFSVLCILLEVVFCVVYQTEQICRSTEPSDKSVGTDCHFEYVCIAGHIDDQDALDSSDPRISDHGTWTVSAGWSEWRYGKDAKALSEN